MTLDDERWELLVGQMRDFDDPEKALEAFEEIDGAATERHLPKLLRLIQEGDWCVREWICQPYARLAGIDALPVLLDALRRGKEDGHDNDSLCATTMDLVEEHRAAAAPVLTDMLESPEVLDRKNAAWLYPCLQEQADVSRLLPLARDPDPAVRGAVAGSLSSFEAAAVFDDLARMAGDSDTEVRVSAVNALGYLGDPRARPILEAARQDPEARVRSFAEYALERVSKHE